MYLKKWEVGSGLPAGRQGSEKQQENNNPFSEQK
jgi:hypothetical protein